MVCFIMKITCRLVIVSLVFGTACLCRADDTKLGISYAGKVSALSRPASVLGEDWTGPTGLVVDDFRDLSKFPGDVKSLVEGLKKLFSPIGVVAVADFTYRKKSNPFHQITLRVFLFDQEASCRKWWANKYRYDGWEKHYTVVGGVPYDAVDSTQITKRALVFGNIWMTCGALKNTEDHLRVLDLYISKIKDVAERK
jgi:hypothetical protein